MQGTCHQTACRAFVFLWLDTFHLSKNGVGHDRNSYLIKAYSLGSISWRDAFGGFLDVWIVKQPGQVGLPVLHDASHETALPRDRLEAEVIMLNCYSIKVVFIVCESHL